MGRNFEFFRKQESELGSPENRKPKKRQKREIFEVNVGLDVGCNLKSRLVKVVVYTFVLGLERLLMFRLIKGPVAGW